MDYQEFRNAVQRVHDKRNITVTKSFGVYDAYKYIRKNHWFNIGRSLKEHEFYSIIRKVNQLLAVEIALGHTIVFPAQMGRLELRKVKNGAKLVDGELWVKYPVDWDKTVRLWFQDEEAYKNKIKLRRENKYTYRVKYCKFRANYNNKIFYEFSLNRYIKKALKNNIDEHKTDTLW